MGIGARFRRWVGIFGAFSVIALTATGAAMTIGQASASAAASSSAFSLDLGIPAGITQNTVGDITPVAVNAGDGWNFVMEGWQVGDQIAISTGTASGGPGVECNTSPFPFGVNQTGVDDANYVLFSSEDASTAVLGLSGSHTPDINVSLGPSAVDPKGHPCGPSGDSATLLLTVTGTDGFTGVSAPSTTTTAQIYLGGAIGGVFGNASADLVYDTGFGANIGPVVVAGAYYPAFVVGVLVGSPFGAGTSGLGDLCDPGALISDCTTPAPITVPSDATVTGEVPAANSPASGVPRVTGLDIVIPTAISNFTINEPGAFLPPNTGPGVSDANEAIQTVDAQAPGYVCVMLDNSTRQNLAFASTPTWGVAASAGTAGFSAAAGPATVINLGTTLALPVSSASNAAATWTASGLSLATIPGHQTHADGPVWAYVFWDQLPLNSPPNDNNSNAVLPCAPTLIGGDISAVKWSPITVDTPEPGALFGWHGNPDNGGSGGDTTQLGYVQLSTVSELANSISGATSQDTAAQAVGHQFNYAAGDCVGSAFSSFRANGGAIFLATVNDYHDALGAAYPAGADDSGVILTDPNTLSQAAADIIRQEGVQVVYIVGGPLAISNNVQNTLANTPSYHCGGFSPRLNEGLTENLVVIRIAGQTADDTNLLLATFPGAQVPTPGFPFGAFNTPALFNDTGTNDSTSAPVFPVQNIAILTTDANFQDAVSGSALAYAWPMPLIVTPGNGLSLDALAAILNDHISEFIVLGGPLAITGTVMSQLHAIGVSALRVAGMDGSETSTQLASFELAGAITMTSGFTVTVGLGQNNDDFDWSAFVARTAGEIGDPGYRIYAHAVLLARGDYWADAESAAGVLAVHNGLYGHNTTFKPLVLSESSGAFGIPASLGAFVTTFLNQAGLAVSGLPGQLPASICPLAPGATDEFCTPGTQEADGWADFSGFNFGEQWNGASSNVYTVQPIGGFLALPPGVLLAADLAITAG